ncbi:hypothetical protein ASD8599_03791 [Ascidiaceihabitans donghaensis]|uniref:Uncharacterized protein n=1 Tax=Ascidiaceihabitans donghaensis TaxID=1510460 RepID=A0A2R8BP17_9RHOB|nr:zinc-binding dehydrogenase [Ascidiaceihabitans donghaensis]SPH27325.1 hypothetical protein ASD8599_03791 [Ascidiaceihabitans donghaensis]
MVAELGAGSIDVVIDLVAGEQWPSLLEVLRRGGRYLTAGAIAGPMSQIDVRTLDLKDLTLMRCTFQEDEVFTNSIRYIEANEIRSVVAKTYPLRDIAQALYPYRICTSFANPPNIENLARNWDYVNFYSRIGFQDQAFRVVLCDERPYHPSHHVSTIAGAVHVKL